MTHSTTPSLPAEIQPPPGWLDVVLIKRILVFWAAALIATACLVATLEGFAPRLLWRDQSAASWHLQREAWALLESAPYGTDGRREALESAAEMFREAADRTPSVGRYRMNLAQALEELDRDEEAYEQALAAIPHCASDDVQSIDFAALLAYRVGAWEDARRLAERAVGLRPTEPRPRELLARSLIAMGRVDEGVETFQKRLDELPATPEARLQIGLDAAAVSRYDKAAQWLGELAELGLVEGKYWLILAVVRAGANDVEGAATALAQYAREKGMDRPVLPDSVELGLPALDPDSQKRLTAAYRRGFAADWR